MIKLTIKQTGRSIYVNPQNIETTKRGESSTLITFSNKDLPIEVAEQPEEILVMKAALQNNWTEDIIWVSWDESERCPCIVFAGIDENGDFILDSDNTSLPSGLKNSEND